MDTPLLADSFVTLLKKSGLVPDELIEPTLASLGVEDASPAKEVARGFLKRGLLTRFQAERLLEGRFRGFFIDRYKVLEILGAGGMACLYLAEDLESGALVALKVISDKHKSDAGMLTRLKIEARAGKKLNHPGIIRTFDIHKTDDVFGEAFYLVMEYVEGVNLEELINLKGPIQWEQAADFIRQAAAGLGHAHSSGLIHRDVKPGNLLVDARGTVRILDFGLALLDSHEDADEFSLAMIFGHSCLGTADYIAPEQSVDSFAVDSRADVYGLGCTLYVALTGKLPYPMAASSQKLEGHRRQAPPPVRTLAPTVPEGLALVVDKMMAKLPSERYQSMAAVVEALSPFARRQPVEFDFPKVLAWRAKDARRRTAGIRRTGGSSGAALSTNPSKQNLRSASTRRFPEAAAETAVAPESEARRDAVSLVAPFDGAGPDASLSRPELPAPGGRQGPVLVALNGGPDVALHGRRFVIGRSDDSDLQISSGMVSGKHCELLFDGSVWRIRDLESKNGTQVHGASITEQVLMPGAQFTIAQQYHYRLVYTVGPRDMNRGLARWFVLGAIAVGLAVAGWSIWSQLNG
jgi:eukaryotic-like serine/threonine-protein kinase